MNENAIELLKGMLPQKVSYADLIGASCCYGDKYVYEDPEPYAIELAISALEKQLNNGWIACSERLPNESGAYLIYYKDGFGNKGQYVLYWDIGRKGFYPKWPNNTSRREYAWQPLPEPYEVPNEN